MATAYDGTRSHQNRGQRRSTRRLVRLIFKALIVSCATLIACVSNPQTSPDKGHDEGQIIRLSAADNGRTITANSGDRLLIGLERAGATGYEWHMDRSSATHWTLLDETSGPASPSDSHKRVGAPVIQQWVLTLTQKGRIDITIRLYREWEGAAQHVDVFEIAVVIR